MGNHHELSKRRATRFSRPWVLVTVAVLGILALALSFAAGWLLRTPPWVQQAQEQSKEIPVWAVVEHRVVSDNDSFAGSVHAGVAVPIMVPMPGIVTRVGYAVGDIIAPGSLAGVVDGKPYFFLTGPLPLYRDLEAGDSGDDVIALQTALKAAGYDPGRIGKVGSATIAAVRKLFVAAGFEPSADVAIPNAQFLTLPDGDRIVTEIAPIATKLNTEKPLLTIRTGSPYGQIIADVVTAGELSVGAELTMRLGAENVTVMVTKIGDFQEAKDSTSSGKPVQLSAKDAANIEKLKPGSSFTVGISSEHPAGIAVPLTTVRRDINGDYVLRKTPATTDNKAGTALRVSIKIEYTADGWVAVTGELQPGDLVRVS